jgi:hypothetical protein
MFSIVGEATELIVEELSADGTGLAGGGEEIATGEGLSAGCVELECGGLSAGWAAEVVFEVLAGSGDALN